MHYQNCASLIAAIVSLFPAMAFAVKAIPPTAKANTPAVGPCCIYIDGPFNTKYGIYPSYGHAETSPGGSVVIEQFRCTVDATCTRPTCNIPSNFMVSGMDLSQRGLSDSDSEWMNLRGRLCYYFGAVAVASRVLLPGIYWRSSGYSALSTKEFYTEEKRETTINDCAKKASSSLEIVSGPFCIP